MRVSRRYSQRPGLEGREVETIGKQEVVVVE